MQIKTYDQARGIRGLRTYLLEIDGEAVVSVWDVHAERRVVLGAGAGANRWARILATLDPRTRRRIVRHLDLRPCACGCGQLADERAALIHHDDLATVERGM